MPEQFVIPQFIDVEPKLLGPITPRQFIIVFVGVMICAIFKLLFAFNWFVIASIPVGIITIVVAFVKVNGQGFHFFLLNIIQTLRKPKLRVWQKDLSTEYIQRFVNPEQAVPTVHMEHKRFIGASRLNELSLIVNTGGAYQPESEDVL
ncbi:MAG: PrgI family protein [Candidatus Magasanikbacteria bacterium]|nr:PrgI family protein [Candidatus Magasanikbacteria bacterium]